MSWRNRVEVSYGALRHNLARVRELAAPRQVVAVAKADAYGLGLERCARIYHEAGAVAIAVAALAEADRVRRAVPRARVMLLGSPLPEERPAVVASGYEVWVSSEEEVHEYAHLACAGSPARLHLAVDTGMGRAGVAPGEATALARAIRDDPHLVLAGIATHYPQAQNPAFSAGQEAALGAVLAAFGPRPADCLVHCANSEGLLVRPGAGADAVRVGLLLTGTVPAGCEDPGLRPALRWVSAITLVKQLPAGHGISYDRTRILENDRTVALVPVGYADGYPLRCSDRGSVLVHGRRCPILGRVTMDYLIIDGSGLARPPVPGDQVVLLGDQDRERITVAELARWAETIPYDVLCGLRGRCEVVGVA